jgi:hypothetical protein
LFYVYVENSNSDEEVGLLSHKATVWEPFLHALEVINGSGQYHIKSIEVFKLIHDEYDKSEGEEKTFFKLNPSYYFIR